MAFDIVNQPVLILAHAEEIAFLLHRLAGAAAVRADLFPVLFHQLGRRPEALAGGAVHALVLGLVNVALVVETAEDLLHDLHMALLGSADEIVVFDVHQLPQGLRFLGDLIHELLGRHAGFLGLFFDFLAVLVQTGEEIGIVSLHLLKAGHGIGRHGGVGVADVHVPAGIINRGGDIKGFLFRHDDHVLSVWHRAKTAAALFVHYKRNKRKNQEPALFCKNTNIFCEKLW